MRLTHTCPIKHDPAACLPWPSDLTWHYWISLGRRVCGAWQARACRQAGIGLLPCWPSIVWKEVIHGWPLRKINEVMWGHQVWAALWSSAYGFLSWWHCVLFATSCLGTLLPTQYGENWPCLLTLFYERMINFLWINAIKSNILKKGSFWKSGRRVAIENGVRFIKKRLEINGCAINLILFGFSNCKLGPIHLVYDSQHSR